jgi:hypothetical protein
VEALLPLSIFKSISEVKGMNHPGPLENYPEELRVVFNQKGIAT